MSNQWLRLWHDMPNDPKWRTISRVSGQPIALVQAVYVHLLVEASRNVTRGHAGVTAEDLASALDVTDGDIEAVLQAMQGRVLDGFRLLGWEKRQPKREDGGDEKTGAKSASQRKAEQRAREKAAREAAAEGGAGAVGEECHATSRNVTTDKEKEKSVSSLRSETRTACHDDRDGLRDTSDAGQAGGVTLSAPEPAETEAWTTAAATSITPGLVCRAMKAEGVADVAPGHPTLVALLDAGAVQAEFVSAAQKAAKSGKGFAYALGIVTNARREAAELASSIKRGAPPAARRTPTPEQFSAVSYGPGGSL